MRSNLLPRLSLSLTLILLRQDSLPLLSSSREGTASNWGATKSRMGALCDPPNREPHIMLFRRPLNYHQNQENQAQAHQGLLSK